MTTLITCPRNRADTTIVRPKPARLPSAHIESSKDAAMWLVSKITFTLPNLSPKLSAMDCTRPSGALDTISMPTTVLTPTAVTTSPSSIRMTCWNILVGANMNRADRKSTRIPIIAENSNSRRIFSLKFARNPSLYSNVDYIGHKDHRSKCHVHDRRSCGCKARQCSNP